MLPALRNIVLPRLWLRKVFTAFAETILVQFLIASIAAWEFVKTNKDKIDWDLVVLNPPYASFLISSLASF